ncbi:maltokinase [Streptomyces sp. 21So2-11]|uniref:maltokinase N-terminal cap-like domain-containing protein n=1 Tax=Streptomyces sp. 21So2-11 TaxID=3144408 RepID=UPI00321C1200
MSEAASTRSTASIRSTESPWSTESSTTPVAPPPTLLPSLVPLLREWLPRQRWFAGKGRPITGFTLISATELLPMGSASGPGLLHLLVRVQQPVPSAQPPPVADCYQLLIGVRATLPVPLAPALIGHVQDGPLAGRTVYEALQDPRLAELLLQRLRTPGTPGTLRFQRDPAVTVPAGLSPRMLTTEQSNSSLVYGDAYILKVFRRIHPGLNPDLELPLALARKGCGRVPAPVAWFEAANTEDRQEPYTLGVLQPFLYGSEDGWQRALRALRAGDDFTSEAWALGRATAEVHTALADALPTMTLSKQQTELLAGAMTERLEAAAQAVPQLVPYVPALRTAFDAVAALGRAGRAWSVQRVHGDLHLGQTLRAPDGEWSVIDFEGEPARPLTERRRPQPVVRDVAGMFRSFDYAARSCEPWDPGWAERCRAAFCEGYAHSSGSDPREEPELLRAYETDKAIYEVLYEARHRPDWLPVPLAAVHRLAADARPAPAPAPAPAAPPAGEPDVKPDVKPDVAPDAKPDVAPPPAAGPEADSTAGSGT